MILDAASSKMSRKNSTEGGVKFATRHSKRDQQTRRLRTLEDSPTPEELSSRRLKEFIQDGVAQPAKLAALEGE